MKPDQDTGYLCSSGRAIRLRGTDIVADEMNSSFLLAQSIAEKVRTYTKSSSENWVRSPWAIKPIPFTLHNCRASGQILVSWCCLQGGRFRLHSSMNFTSPVLPHLEHAEWVYLKLSKAFMKVLKITWKHLTIALKIIYNNKQRWIYLCTLLLEISSH